MHECASAESWPAAVSRAWRLQGQIDRALAWSDSQHGVRPASHRGLTLNSAQKGAKASRLNCRSAAVPHESDGARELRMALSGCVNRSSEPAASRKRIWFHLAMKVRPMQQIADHIVGSRPILCGILAVIDEEIKALKWKLWHGQLERAICALEKII